MTKSLVSSHETPVITLRSSGGLREPTEFAGSYLLTYDFDNTCFFTIGSGGPDVEAAYIHAVGETFGTTAQNNYVARGGLQNRAPADIVLETITNDTFAITHALDQAHALLEPGNRVAAFDHDAVERFVARGEVKTDQLAIRAVTELLVMRKKEILLPQITPEWPRPMEGFDEHWSSLYGRRLMSNDWETVHTAIVSSGHTDFISKVLHLACLPEPDVYLTDDEMKLQPEPKTKPDPLALELVRDAWIRGYRLSQRAKNKPRFMDDTKNRQVYIGDDLEKDGQMAAADGVTFMHYDGTPDKWHQIDKAVMRIVETGADFGK